MATLVCLPHPARPKHVRTVSSASLQPLQTVLTQLSSPQDSRFRDGHTQPHRFTPQSHRSLALRQGSLLFQLICEFHKTIAPGGRENQHYSDQCDDTYGKKRGQEGWERWAGAGRRKGEEGRRSQAQYDPDIVESLLSSSPHSPPHHHPGLLPKQELPSQLPTV